MKLSLNYLYLPVALIFLFLIYLFRSNSLIQMELIVTASITYVTIALLHHHLDKSLTLEIIIEYILIAILVLIVLQGQLL